MNVGILILKEVELMMNELNYTFTEAVAAVLKFCDSDINHLKVCKIKDDEFLSNVIKAKNNEKED